MRRRLAFEDRTGFDAVKIPQVLAPRLCVEGGTPPILASEPLVAQQAIDVIVTAETPDSVVFPIECAACRM
jgi:hypothetical protein